MVYRRYTNFSQEPVIQNFNITPDFGKRITCSIAHTADLISNMYLYLELPNIPSNNNILENMNRAGYFIAKTMPANLAINSIMSLNSEKNIN